MAQLQQVLFIDDLDGGEAAGTVRFALDGADYEIDLSTIHEDELRKELEPFIEHARQLRTSPAGQRPGARRHRTAQSRDDNARMRAWLRANGYDVESRGKVPGWQQERYDQQIPAGRIDSSTTPAADDVKTADDVTANEPPVVPSIAPLFIAPAQGGDDEQTQVEAPTIKPKATRARPASKTGSSKTTAAKADDAAKSTEPAPAKRAKGRRAASSNT